MRPERGGLAWAAGSAGGLAWAAGSAFGPAWCGTVGAEVLAVPVDGAEAGGVAGDGADLAGSDGSSRARSIRASGSGLDSVELRCAGGRPVGVDSYAGVVVSGSTVAVVAPERLRGLGREPGGRGPVIRLAAAPVARPAAKAASGWWPGA
ncbi:hypothetical protein ADL15_16950 [Actinoplanes awajinensis subsp. mycoplanecinus]|uniref:Uncharacterized protein n=1 Tax=Actinoplanes awajinensis subsp. mycoplanecinus TaxID=135947 RepID=A0A0X3UNT3_9ACTN|nr:hypothetical protein ADL15_16950 [Actinoplanes awajinensis subsp. mycoplanecinus]